MNNLEEYTLSERQAFAPSYLYSPETTASQHQKRAAVTSALFEQLLRLVIALGICFSLYAAIRGFMFDPLILDAEKHGWVRMIVRPAILWGTLSTLLLGFRSFLWFRYKSAPPATMQDAPTMTVIIPAYNEGPMVLQSIDSAAKARYPRERLEILVVDDGSKDDTWHYIELASMRYPGLVVATRLPENRGKRAALATGFEKARGEIVVSLDSDSVVDADSLLAIAGPFRDESVGAVAGKVKVYNRSEGIIPRMLHVRFVVAFDFVRAAESGFRNVYCCPGALTAYRTSLVREVLPEWLAQTFLGAPCTVGEDRALTNLILAYGHDTVYQRSAVVHTVAPVSYSKLCRMLLRWDRSYVREEVQFLRVVWKRPARSKFIAITDRIISNMRYPVHYASLLLLLILLPQHPLMVFRFVTVVGIISGFNMLYYLRSELSSDVLYGLVYSYFSLMALFWIFPVAVFTVRSRSWLTR